MLASKAAPYTIEINVLTQDQWAYFKLMIQASTGGKEKRNG